MPVQASRDNAHQTASPFLAPALAIAMWNPFLAGALRRNGEAHEGLATLAGEWQNFLGRRLKEDLILVQRLAASTSPQQMWVAYAEFLEKAAEDYGSEWVTMSKLAAGVTNNALKATQSATEEPVANPFPSMKAA